MKYAVGLQIGEAVEIVTPDTAGCCATVDTIGSGTLTLRLRPESDDVPACRPKQNLELRGISREGIWTCSVTVQAVHQSKLQVSIPRQFQVLQRRESFRLAVAIDTTVKDLQSAKEYPASLYDLSDGGVCLSANSEIGDQVEVLLPLCHRDLRARGTVVRRQKPNGKKNTSILGIKFEGLTPCDSRRIAQFIIAEQGRRVM